MKLIISMLVGLIMAMVVSGELLEMLKNVEQSDAFKQMSPQDQIIIVDIVAAAETCKLTELANMIGTETVVRVLSHIPGTEQQMLIQYLSDHKAAEANGTCTIE